MAAPILYLGLALAGGLFLANRKSGSSEAVPKTTTEALVDPSERQHPNAGTAVKAISNAMTVNSMTLYEMTAVAIDTQLRMPKTAFNLRAFAQMAKQGGSTIAGDDDDDDDEVGARRRRKKAAAAPAAPAKRKKKRKKRRAAAPMTPELAAADAEPTVSNVLAAAYAAPESSPAAPYEFENEEEDEDEDEDEVGAGRRRKLPDWLRFSATQSMLAGDPRFIKATAQVMRRMGYVEHADIHLRALNAHI